jgi:protein-tyrosine phosphatase
MPAADFLSGAMKRMEKYRVLLVCMGNICRSPAAEAIVRSLGKKAGLHFLEVDSAGTHASHDGEKPDSRMRKAAAKRALDLEALCARRLKEADFSCFDQILAMDRQNLEYLRKKCPPRLQDKLGLFMDYARKSAEEEIPDPYYGNVQGFERVLDLCEDAGQGLIDHIRDQY